MQSQTEDGHVKKGLGTAVDVLSAVLSRGFGYAAELRLIPLIGPYHRYIDPSGSTWEFGP
jgi:hypothetical protein